jgi:beta-glucosidase
VTEARIDESVRRVLAVKIRLGLFERPYTDESRVAAVLADPRHREEARRAAQRSLVLLRNRDGLLPLSDAVRSVAVVGPLADSKAGLEGSWMVFGHVPAAVTVLEGIRARLPRATVAHAPGPAIRREIPSFIEEIFGGPPAPLQTPAEEQAAFDHAVQTARAADVVIAVMGETANMSGEASSRASLDLPGRQEELLRAIAALGKPMVLVLINGRPLGIDWAAQNVPAILEAWQPGTEGGRAVADVLFGDVTPGGKLPVTFPRRGGHAPLYYARNRTHMPEGSPLYRSRYGDGPTTPLFPFGFGLSYTTFSFANLKAAPAQVKAGGRVTVSVDVTNTGRRAGEEVVQLYVHQKSGRDSRPQRELKGFRRVVLAPGETQAVRFELGPEELRYWSTSERAFVQDAAEFDLWAGGDVTAALHATLQVVP